MTTKMTAHEIAERQTEAVNRHDGVAYARGYSENTKVIDPVYPEPLAGRAAVERDMVDFLITFPDFHYRQERVVVEGDLLIFEGVVTGTHLGPLALPSGLVPATNRKVQFRIAGFSNIDSEGLISEEHRYYDVAGVLDQLGLMQ